MEGYVGGASNGVQGQSPCWEVRGAKPAETESFLAFARLKDRQICSFLLILVRGKLIVNLNTREPGTLVVVDRLFPFS